MSNHIMVDRRFHHAVIRVYSILPFQTKDLATLTLLTEMLQNRAPGYRTPDQIMAQCEAFYALEFDCTHTIVDQNILFSLTFTFIDEKMVEEKRLFERIVRFLKGIVYDESPARFTKKLMKEQQKILANKLKQYYDRPQYIVRHGLYQSLNENWPIAISPYGAIEDVMQVTKEDVLDMHHRLVNAPRSYFYVGPYAKTRVERVLNHCFGAPTTLPKKQVYTPQLDHPFLVIKEKEMLQSELLFAYRVDRDYEKEALHLFNDILGVLGSNKLFREIREKQGLCYQISSAILPHYHLLLVAVEVDQKNILKTQEVLEKCMRHIHVTKQELVEAKRMARSELIMQFDQATALLIKQIRHEQEGTLASKAALLKKYRAVTWKEMNAIAKQITYQGCFILKGVKK